MPGLIRGDADGAVVAILVPDEDLGACVAATASGDEVTPAVMTGAAVDGGAAPVTGGEVTTAPGGLAADGCIVAVTGDIGC